MDRTNPGGERDVIDFVSSITDTARLRIEENLPHGFVRLKVAEAERRQAQHDIRSVEDIVTELVRNSRDAGAARVLVGFQKEQSRYRRITVLDDGCGIPADVHNLVFEPRVTSKRDDFEEDRYGVHGRGMALFSIRSRAQGVSIVSSVPGFGTAITLTVDTEKVPERSDQATVPLLEAVNGVDGVGPGPHNVPRVMLEMSVDSPGVEFYLGSFAEVLATVKKLGASMGGGSRDEIWSDVVSITDARALAEASTSDLGIPVSERNAYRVLGGEVTALETVFSLAKAAGGVTGRDDGRGIAERQVAREASRKKASARSPLKRLGAADMDEIAEGSSEVVERVLGRYFLKTAGLPRVRRGRGRIMISFYVTGEDGEEQ